MYGIPSLFPAKKNRFQSSTFSQSPRVHIYAFVCIRTSAHYPFLGVVLDHLLALACINVAFHPYIRAPMRVHHAPFPSSFSVLTPTHFGMHVP